MMVVGRATGLGARFVMGSIVPCSNHGRHPEGGLVVLTREAKQFICKCSRAVSVELIAELNSVRR